MTPEPAPTSLELPGEAFSSLAPGEQRIAHALHDAQTPGHSARPTRLWRRSLDDIARMKRSGAEWSQIFKQLKGEGLLAEQTLGQVVARWTLSREPANPATSHLRAVPRAAPSPLPR